MISINKHGGFYAQDGIKHLSADNITAIPDDGYKKTIAWRIMAEHNHSACDDKLKLRFDALASHDITYVGIVQTAKASGMTKFPIPYVLTNCHNSLCAVGGTINEDDHTFGLSAAMRYGGDYVPAHLAVIHQYVRETMAGCGKMILGSDSHTRFGALGTMGVGEGGPELVKQLLGQYYETNRPEIVAIWLQGKPRAGVGPQDVALAIIKAVFKDGIVKNRVMEFIGPGVAALSTEYRIGIDVMTTETTCLTSIWQTDTRTEKYLKIHGRQNEYKKLEPETGAFYNTVITVNLDKIEPMIALPFHPSNAWSIREFLANADDLLAMVEKESAEYVDHKKFKPALRQKFKTGQFFADQAVIAGCAGGGYENISIAAKLLQGRASGTPGFNLSVYPASQPIFLQLMRDGAATWLMGSGAILRTAFCGPCFGAGDIPMNNGFSIRHATRNFPNREGSQPGSGQMSFVALMDARSIAATSANLGKLTPADEYEGFPEEHCLEDHFSFDKTVYESRVYHSIGKPDPQTELVYGPGIADWPAMPPLPENILLEVAAAIYDPVTTTDELIPSGETSSYRSNPMRLAEFTLSRKDPDYVKKAKTIQKMALEHTANNKAAGFPAELTAVQMAISTCLEKNSLTGETGIGSAVFAIKPGDGSAREQAASCQKVLGGWANIVQEYATKRYRSNLINWGILPLHCKDWEKINPRTGDYFYIPNIRQAVTHALETIPAIFIRNGKAEAIQLQMAPLTTDERQILLDGCLINHYVGMNKSK